MEAQVKSMEYGRSSKASKSSSKENGLWVKSIDAQAKIVDAKANIMDAQQSGHLGKETFFQFIDSSSNLNQT